MNNKVLYIMGITGALLLLATFLFPIWRITLEAPQYPDGINMYIWINQISGDTPHTLKNVNILNHYIGMKEINPDSIPELVYFPYIIVFMSLTGVVVSILNKPKLILFWIILMIILAIAGVYDFYLWQYDYGHNLDPKAVIKVPGMTYQPPLFGSKFLLNFKATSLPHTGSYLLGLGVLLLALQWFLLIKKEVKK